MHFATSVYHSIYFQKLKSRRFAAIYVGKGLQKEVKSRKNGRWRGQNIGLLKARVRHFPVESADVYLKEVRCSGFSGRKNSFYGRKKL